MNRFFTAASPSNAGQANGSKEVENNYNASSSTNSTSKQRDDTVRPAQRQKTLGSFFGNSNNVEAHTSDVAIAGSHVNTDSAVDNDDVDVDEFVEKVGVEAIAEALVESGDLEKLDEGGDVVLEDDDTVPQISVEQQRREIQSQLNIPWYRIVKE